MVLGGSIRNNFPICSPAGLYVARYFEFLCISLSFYLSANRPIDRMSDWLNDCPTNQPTHPNQPTERLTNRPTGRSTDWLTDWMTDRPTDRLTDRPTDRPTDWLNAWLTVLLSDWQTDRLPEFLADWQTNGPILLQSNLLTNLSSLGCFSTPTCWRWKNEFLTRSSFTSRIRAKHARNDIYTVRHAVQRIFTRGTLVQSFKLAIFLSSCCKLGAFHHVHFQNIIINTTFRFRSQPAK